MTTSEKPNLGLMTLEQAADIMPAGITKRTLNRLIAEGRLPRIRIGRRLYLTEHDLRTLVECRDRASLPASTSAPILANGSFETERPPGGQAAALASAEKLKRHSRSTSQTGRPRGEVVRLSLTR